MVELCRKHAGSHRSASAPPHAEYLALCPDRETWTGAYRALCEEVLPELLLREIRVCLRQQKALGANRCREWVNARTGRFAPLRPVGRPACCSNCPWQHFRCAARFSRVVTLFCRGRR